MHRPSYDYPGEFVFLRKAGTFAPSTIRMGVPADASLNTLLEEFVNFVKACGYHVPSGSVLDFVDEVTGRPLDDPHLEDTIESDGTASEDTD
jgi:hypothetical protein